MRVNTLPVHLFLSGTTVYGCFTPTSGTSPEEMSPWHPLQLTYVRMLTALSHLLSPSQKACLLHLWSVLLPVALDLWVGVLLSLIQKPLAPTLCWTEPQAPSAFPALHDKPCILLHLPSSSHGLPPSSLPMAQWAQPAVLIFLAAAHRHHVWLQCGATDFLLKWELGAGLPGGVCRFSSCFLLSWALGCASIWTSSVSVWSRTSSECVGRRRWLCHRGHRSGPWPAIDGKYSWQGVIGEKAESGLCRMIVHYPCCAITFTLNSSCSVLVTLKITRSFPLLLQPSHSCIRTSKESILCASQIFSSFAFIFKNFPWKSQFGMKFSSLRKDEQFVVACHFSGEEQAEIAEIQSTEKNWNGPWVDVKPPQH